MENKTGKYFKYAIGEIFLVIIGILIALQINIWNENRKNKLDLNNSLHAMVNELSDNIQYMSIEKDNFQFRIDGLKRILNDSVSEEDLKIIPNFFALDFKSKSFSKVFELIKGNKQLQLIEDKDLIKKINQFYEYALRDMEVYTKWHAGFVSDNIDPYILENIPIENDLVNPNVAKALLTQVKFKNILSYQKIFYQDYIDLNTNNINEAELLKRAVDLYIKDKN
ncbi:hypothetical protein [Winogradskyella helgolandensis]|uniref:hypothetical protein n=1 Tax=Winogradskyella helgolandensis TaxID=2697010 RepID=UPI0015BFA2EE|nr:hypothetical protein [Winogradskyella helgolandensis]